MTISKPRAAATALPKYRRSPSRMAPRRTTREGHAATPYILIAPATIFFLLFVGLPLVQTAWFSFFAWDGVSASTWVGLGNYVNAFNDPTLLRALGHSMLFVVTFCIVPVLLGLIFAAIFSQNQLPGYAFFRTVLFLPQVIATVVVGVAWRWMYSDTGTLNQILNAFGIHADTAWLGDFTWALPAMGVVGAWVMTGLCMVLFLAGVGKIEGELYDAAKVDGAGPILEFLSVTLPGLRGEISVATTITLIAALRTFDLVFVTTGGGPGTSTIVPGTEIYRLAFRDGQVGAASTISILLTLMIFVVVYGITRLLREDRA